MNGRWEVRTVRREGTDLGCLDGRKAWNENSGTGDSL